MVKQSCLSYIANYYLTRTSHYFVSKTSQFDSVEHVLYSIHSSTKFSCLLNLPTSMQGVQYTISSHWLAHCSATRVSGSYGPMHALYRLIFFVNHGVCVCYRILMASFVER